MCERESFLKTLDKALNYITSAGDYTGKELGDFVNTLDLGLCREILRHVIQIEWVRYNETQSKKKSKALCQECMRGVIYCGDCDLDEYDKYHEIRDTQMDERFEEVMKRVNYRNLLIKNGYTEESIKGFSDDECRGEWEIFLSSNVQRN